MPATLVKEEHKKKKKAGKLDKVEENPVSLSSDENGHS